VEADKSQVDKYKSLLLKQRDIMIALTARLNERDEQILTLQVRDFNVYYAQSEALLLLLSLPLSLARLPAPSILVFSVS
jgi:hypothetical protein